MLYLDPMVRCMSGGAPIAQSTGRQKLTLGLLSASTCTAKCIQNKRNNNLPLSQPPNL